MKVLSMIIVLLGVVGVVCFARPSDQVADDAARTALHHSYLLEQQGSYTEAVNCLAALPKSYLVSYRLGWLYYLQTDYAASSVHYREAMKISPASIEAKLGYTLPLLAQRRYDEVEKVARQVLKLDGNHYLGSMRLAYALRMQHEYAQADAVLTRLLRFYPTDVGLLVEHGLVLQARQQPHAARQVFETVLTLDPTNTVARAQLTR
jgi:tetratricopeptide (TPR) repeat protein